MKSFLFAVLGFLCLVRRIFSIVCQNELKQDTHMTWSYFLDTRRFLVFVAFSFLFVFFFQDKDPILSAPSLGLIKHFLE